MNIDPGTPTTARLWNAWQDGSANFDADRRMAADLEAGYPGISRGALATREFTWRAVRLAAAGGEIRFQGGGEPRVQAGIRDWIDAGCGLPAPVNVHDMLLQAAPGSRLTYLDSDPLAVGFMDGLVAGIPGVKVVQGDLADTEVMDAVIPGVPAGLILGAVLHYYPPDEASAVVREWVSRLASGSCVIVTTGCAPAETMTRFSGEYTAAAVYSQSPGSVAEMLDGTDLVWPGVQDVERLLTVTSVPPRRTGFYVGAVAYTR